jgi:phenylacetate-CoA ligase
MKSVVRDIFFPVHEFLKGHSSLSYLHEFERSQWFRKEQLYRIQAEKMRELIKHACANVPYYRGLAASGIDVKNVSTPEDLKKLPFLTKDLIRRDPEALKSEKCKAFVRSNTGGSTGSPLIFYLGKKRISADVAAKLRATRWWGVDIGDREAVIWGSPVELTKQDLIRHLRDRLFNTKLLSAFEMTEEAMLAYIHFIRRYRPRHVFGYPSSICLLCRCAAGHNIRLDDIGVRVVFCTAERLYDYQAELISEAFAAPVANGYGGRDLGFVAHECPLGGMHITAESVIVEIVDHDGTVLPPGKRGEIVITHLDSQDYPFIRYRSGDIGELSEEACDCGRGLPLLKEIEGRTTDFILTPDGKIMHGLSLIYVLREIPGINEFRIVQEETDSFVIDIVRAASFRPESEALIKDGFKKRIGGDIKIIFNHVEKIECGKSGKFRYLISKVPLTGQSSYAGIKS